MTMSGVSVALFEYPGLGYKVSFGSCVELRGKAKGRDVVDRKDETRR